MQDFNSTILSLQQDVNQLHASDTARNIWSGPAAALTFGGLLLNIYLFCRQRPQLDAKKQQDERDMDLVLDTLGIEKNKPIEPIYPYEKILACCSSKYKNIVNDKITNNSIKPQKQDIKALIKLKLQEINNSNHDASIIAQDSHDKPIKRITRSNSLDLNSKDLEMSQWR